MIATLPQRFVWIRLMDFLANVRKDLKLLTRILSQGHAYRCATQSVNVENALLPTNVNVIFLLLELRVKFYATVMVIQIVLDLILKD